MGFHPPRGVRPAQLEGKRTGRPRGSRTHASAWSDISWAYANIDKYPVSAPNGNAYNWWKYGISHREEFTTWVERGGRVPGDVISKIKVQHDEEKKASELQSLDFEAAKRRVAELELRVAEVEKELQKEREDRQKMNDKVKQVLREFRSDRCGQKPISKPCAAGLKEAESEDTEAEILTPNRPRPFSARYD
jgi:hypothetical protein